MPRHSILVSLLSYCSLGASDVQQILVLVSVEWRWRLLQELVVLRSAMDFDSFKSRRYKTELSRGTNSQHEREHEDCILSNKYIPRAI
eukprot:m.282464 g.282464  ORF g.282464 m.282464 type:complete len:88 (-) comp19850_c0_seq1:189-452(-)